MGIPGNTLIPLTKGRERFALMFFIVVSPNKLLNKQ